MLPAALSGSSAPAKTDVLAPVPPSMDYAGQRLAETIYQWVIITCAVVGFVIGFVKQSMMYTMMVVGGGILASLLIVVPGWKMFRSHPLRWLPASTPVAAATGAQS